MKEVNNGIKQNHKNETGHICHLNECNAACLMTCLASCFKRANHVQNLSLKKSEAQELRYN